MLSMVELQFAAGASTVYPLHMDASRYTNWNMARAAISQLPTEVLRWQVMSAHVMGGCGMGMSKESAVCTESGSVHEVEGLSVMDGSLFPTSLGVNPQLSIYALVAKLAANQARAMTGHLPSGLDNLLNSKEKHHD